MPHPGTPNVLSEVIRRVCTQEGWTNQTTLADLAGVSDPTVTRWAADEAQPRWHHIQAIIAHHPDVRVRRAFAALIQRPEDDELSDDDLDVNHDGRIDAEDAADLSLQINDISARLQHVVQAIRKAGEFTTPVRADLSRLLKENAGLLRHDADVMDRLSEEIKEHRVNLAFRDSA
ncbi:MAG: helix-turn-helix transcriptional regulator [Planctomycetota bacterium]